MLFIVSSSSSSSSSTSFEKSRSRDAQAREKLFNDMAMATTTVVIPFRSSSSFNPFTLFSTLCVYFYPLIRYRSACAFFFHLLLLLLLFLFLTRFSLCSVSSFVVRIQRMRKMRKYFEAAARWVARRVCCVKIGVGINLYAERRTYRI